MVDLGGDVRANPKLSGTRNNVFGIQTGVAISFLVKRRLQKAETHACAVHYVRRPEMDTAEDKLSWLEQTQLSRLPMESVRPDKKANWINHTDNDFDEHIASIDKKTKHSSKVSQKGSIFRLFSLGVVTARDDWVYDFEKELLERKVKALIGAYNADMKKWAAMKKRDKRIEDLDASIKWSRAVKNDLQNNVEYKFDRKNIIEATYRPFVKSYLYFEKHLNEMQYQLGAIFSGEPNPTIAFLSVDSSNPLAVLAVNQHFDYCLLKKGNGGTQSLPRWRYEGEGRRVDNISDWALMQFRLRYDAGKKGSRQISKDAVFHYVYGVLHDPVYREKYAQNLKREFPRIPFYADFWKWAESGEKMMALHIDYEVVKPWNLKRVEAADEKSAQISFSPKPVLKADRDNGVIILDSKTKLTGIPDAAWGYQLANRSALEWILDQYKEWTPKDPTIRAKFNTYRFADHKEKVIDLLTRVTRVSVETMEIVEAMKSVKR